MTTDAEWWDARATTLDDARNAVWSDPDTWDSELEACYQAVACDLDPVLEGGETFDVLDLGCGVGRLTIPFAQRHPNCNVIGLDVSSNMIEHALDAAEAADVANVAFVMPDDEPLRHFQAAWSMLVFQHLSPAQIFDYVSTVGGALRPGGRLRFQYVLGHGASPGARDYRYDEATMTAYCGAAGLSVRRHDLGLVRSEWGWITAEKPDWGVVKP